MNDTYPNIDSVASSAVRSLHVGRWIFRPRLLPSLAAALLVPLFIVLGLWQWQRGEEKAARMAEAAARAALPPVDLTSAATSPEEFAWRPVRLRGRWEPATQILLDNQVQDGQAGYLVYTPLHLATGDTVLVNRGWLPAAPQRSQVPNIALAPREVTLAGVAAPPPSASRWLRDETMEPMAPGVLRVQRLEPAKLAAQLGGEILPITVRLDPGQPDGYVRRWSLPGLQPERHQAYALQWFLFAAIVLGLYLKLNLRRVDQP